MEKKKVYIEEWPKLRDYIETKDITNIVNFVIEQLYTFNGIERIQSNTLEEGIKALVEEEIIPREIAREFTEAIHHQDEIIRLGKCEALLDWFYSSYRNYQALLEKNKNLICQSYGKVECKLGIYTGEFSNGLKHGTGKIDRLDGRNAVMNWNFDKEVKKSVIKKIYNMLTRKRDQS